MKSEWVRGRFRGVYSAARARAGDGARRVPLDLEYGELSDVLLLPVRPPDHGANALRFEQLPRVRFESAKDGHGEGEHTLFDVRIHDFQLLHPAESGKRYYGTLVGELSARLAPEAIEVKPLELVKPPDPMPEPEPATTDDAPAAAAAPRADATPLEPVRPAIPEPIPEHRGDSTSDQDLERLLWLVVPVLLFAVGSALALGCGPRTAGTWLAPLAAAIAIKQTPVRYRVHTALARRWFGGACVLAPIFALLGPLETGWAEECRAPLRAEIALLAMPVVAAALIRTQVWLWTCALIWTAIQLSGCGSPDGNCGAPAVAAPAHSEAPAPTARTPARAPRVGPDGRWPVAPGSAPLPVDVEPGTGAPAAATTTESSAPVATDPADPPNARAASAPGGWVAPSDAVLSLVRISLEQANRDPVAFFDHGDQRRVYVPTDDIFAPGRAEVRREGEVDLARLANLLALRPDHRFAVEVHTDATGDAAGQRALSQRRAAAVSAWLVQRGHLPNDRFTLEPIGADRPLVPPDGSHADQQPNRRLEIRLLDQTGL